METEIDTIPDDPNFDDGSTDMDRFLDSIIHKAKARYSYEEYKNWCLNRKKRFLK